MAWKPEARVLAIDDGPATPADSHADLVGVVVRAASGYVEAVLHDRVRRDGDDATKTMAGMVTGCRAYSNIVAVLVHNVTVAGFNTVDVGALQEATRRPVVAVSKGAQDYQAMQRALLGGGIPGGADKWRRIEGCPDAVVRHRGLSLVPAGLAPHEAIGLVDLCTQRGDLPEPLRLAHLIAAGWVLGQSRGQ